MSKSLTLSLKEEVIQHTRVEAAKAGKSMSQFVSELLEEKYEHDRVISKAETQRRLEALRRILDGPMWDVTENGRMPNADERNARR
jgi:hypothetical protein